MCHSVRCNIEQALKSLKIKIKLHKTHGISSYVTKRLSLYIAKTTLADPRDSAV